MELDKQSRKLQASVIHISLHAGGRGLLTHLFRPQHAVDFALSPRVIRPQELFHSPHLRRGCVGFAVHHPAATASNLGPPVPRAGIFNDFFAARAMGNTRDVSCGSSVEPNVGHSHSPFLEAVVVSERVAALVKIV